MVSLDVDGTLMQVGDKVFHDASDWRWWGKIVEITPAKIIIGWTVGGSFGQATTTVHGSSSALIESKDGWQLKF